MRSRLLKITLRISFAWAIVFLILNIIARTHGIGYAAKCTPIYGETRVFGKGETRTMNVERVYLEISYNPILFPLSYLSGNGKHFGEVLALTYYEENTLEIAAMARIRHEVARNILWFLAVSFTLGFELERLTFHLSRSFKRELK